MRILYIPHDWSSPSCLEVRRITAVFEKELLCDNLLFILDKVEHDSSTPDLSAPVLMRTALETGFIDLSGIPYKVTKPLEGVD